MPLELIDLNSPPVYQKRYALICLEKFAAYKKISLYESQWIHYKTQT